MAQKIYLDERQRQALEFVEDFDLQETVGGSHDKLANPKKKNQRNGTTAPPLELASTKDSDETEATRGAGSPRGSIPDETKTTASTPTSTPTTHSQDDQRRRKQRRYSIACRVIGLLLVGGTLIGLPIGAKILKDKDKDDDFIEQPSQPDSQVKEPPTMSPTVSPVAAALSDLEFARGLLTPLSGYKALSDTTSPQYQALWWLVSEDPEGIEIIRTREEFRPKWIERYVMAVFYYALGGPNWILESQFLTLERVCDWGSNTGQQRQKYWPRTKGLEPEGVVTCNEEGFLETINFGANNMTGIIPSELSKLTALQKFALWEGKALGTLPDSFGSLTQLEFLEIVDMEVSGSIPESFSNLSNLKLLHLGSNFLTGSIPESLYQIPSLHTLALEYNLLTGTIPTTPPGDMARLWIGHNMISGSIPDSIYTTKLNELVLSGNRLTGSLSDKMGTLETIRWLHLSSNRLTGALPAQMGGAKNLEQLALNENQFVGTIPTEFGLLKRLTHLWMEQNQLSGTVPLELSDLSPLELKLEFNKITGNVTMFCEKDALITQISADCGGEDPDLDCPCCETCCDDSSGECLVNLPGVCVLERTQIILEANPFYYGDRVAICECAETVTPFETEVTLSCADSQCQTCNRDNTVCSINEDYTQRFGGDGLYNYFKATFQYVVGRNDTIVFENLQLPASEECQVYVNGEACDSCKRVTCSDDLSGFDVNCENVDEAGSIDLCDRNRPGDMGPLTVFTFQDPIYRDGCPPRFPQWVGQS